MTGKQQAIINEVLLWLKANEYGQITVVKNGEIIDIIKQSRERIKE